MTNKIIHTTQPEMRAMQEIKRVLDQLTPAARQRLLAELLATQDRP